jgi:DNA-binding LacI/PurR family transcriptional regulator
VTGNIDASPPDIAAGVVSAAPAGGPPRPSRRRAAQIRDVARLAGVSHQTVSRVINGSTHVRPETRARVLTAMDQLDYRANPVARALTTGRSRTLGVVTFDVTLFGPASTLHGIERAARDAGYFVSMVGLESLERAAVITAVERLRGIGVDGAVVIAPHLPATTALYDLPQDVPVVAVEGGPHGIPTVAVDQFHGARLATEHLLELGHETVHHVAGPDGREANLRIDGWRAALDDAGARVKPFTRGDWSAASGYELGREIAERDDVTAVFVANDQMAVGVLRALHEHGRTVPDDVSVVGFDDTPEAGFLIPPLTTVRQDFGEMGRRSLQLLLEAIDSDERLETRVTIPATLVTRASTASPRSRA